MSVGLHELSHWLKILFVRKNIDGTVHWRIQCSRNEQIKKKNIAKSMGYSIIFYLRLPNIFICVRSGSFDASWRSLCLTWPSLLASAFCCSPSHTFSRISLVSVCFGSDSFHPLVERILCVSTKILNVLRFSVSYCSFSLTINFFIKQINNCIQLRTKTDHQCLYIHSSH